MIAWRHASSSRVVGDGGKYVVAQVAPSQWEVHYLDVFIGVAGNEEVAMLAAEGYKQRGVENEPTTFYTLPNNWMQFATAQLADVIHALGMAIQYLADAGDDDSNADPLKHVLGRLAVTAAKGWKVEEIALADTDFNALALHVDDQAYVLAAFPLQMLTLHEKMPEVAEQIAELRKRASS